MLFNLNYIDPTAFSIGPLSIKWYGIIIAVGILIGYFIAQESLKYVGLHKDTLVDVILQCHLWVYHCTYLFRDFSMAILRPKPF